MLHSHSLSFGCGTLVHSFSHTVLLNELLRNYTHCPSDINTLMLVSLVAVTWVERLSSSRQTTRQPLAASTLFVLASKQGAVLSVHDTPGRLRFIVDLCCMAMLTFALSGKFRHLFLVMVASDDVFPMTDCSLIYCNFGSKFNFIST
jgi:hypothetical protein